MRCCEQPPIRAFEVAQVKTGLQENDLLKKEEVQDALDDCYECRKRDKKTDVSAKEKLGDPGLDTAG